MEPMPGLPSNKGETSVRAQAKRQNDQRWNGRGGPERTDPPGGNTGASRGFRAQLAGVGLWDLVQMECLARSRLVVRVAGEGGVGYLYFDRGRIVHAATAALLRARRPRWRSSSWTNGSFQPCERPWPDRDRSRTTHEALILQAAKLKDESSNLVHFPGGPRRRW